MNRWQRVVVLFALLCGTLLAAVDGMAVSPALPSIVADLGGAGNLSWIITGYLLTSSVSTPLYGKISDIYGRQMVYEAAIGIFLVGSVLSSLAGDLGLNSAISPMVQLTLFRGLQGLGAGGLMAMANAIVGDVFPTSERGKYVSYIMMGSLAAIIGGPILGGYITDALSWRWIFYLSIPFGLAAIVISRTQLNLPVPEENHDIDYLGAFLLVTAASAFLLVVTWGGTKYVWGSVQILGLAAVSVTATAGFVAQERRVDEPILPLHLLRIPTVVLVVVIALLYGAGDIAGGTYLPVFLQGVLGMSPTHSGFLLLPLLLGMMVTMIVVGSLMDRLGRYKAFVVAGGLVSAVGFGLLGTMGSDTSWTTAATYMVVTGVGVGFAEPVLTVAVQNAVDRKHLGVATSAVEFSMTFGQSIGVALLGALLTTEFTRRLSDHVGGSAASQVGSSVSGAAVQAFSGSAQAAVRIALANSLDTVFLAAAASFVLMALLGLALPNKTLADDFEEVEEYELANDTPAESDD